MNYSQIRAEARELLNGQWGNLILVWLIFYLLSSGFTIVTRIGFGVSLVVGGPFLLSICTIFLKLWRREQFRIEELFDGFKDFSRSLVAYLLVCLYVLLWSLLFIVPGIIASIGYSMTFFILAEDPQISASDAMRKSQQMMYGHKTEYFMLMLSFIGWFFLSILTAGVGFLFLTSYTTMAQTIFYQRIKNTQSGSGAEEVIATINHDQQ